MSLFENSLYRWRETYFVLFPHDKRPSAEAIRQGLQKLSGKHQIAEARENEDAQLEFLTVISPEDFSAMDLSYLEGEEVLQQIVEIREELDLDAFTSQEKSKYKLLDHCDARFEVYHFEQISDSEAWGESEEELLDPGSLLLVLARLARLCEGVAFDPQAGGLL